MTTPRDHGGDMGLAINSFGGIEADWIDLSTGINRAPYPIDNVDNNSWRSLPRSDAHARLLDAARIEYDTDWALVALPGAQAAIQLLPHLRIRGAARILAPTYNEFEAALTNVGWHVDQVPDVAGLTGANLAVVVNPNNPTGTVFTPEMLSDIARSVDLLVVDESFADATPERSLLSHPTPQNVIVLRSFGKFFGLAGLRLGFAAGPRDLIEKMTAAAGPWCVSGPALEIGARAFADTSWQAETRARLATETARIDAIAVAASWQCIGGTALFRLYETSDAKAAQDTLARAQIWSRIFPYSDSWIRLGLPGNSSEWQRLEAALT